MHKKKKDQLLTLIDKGYQVTLKEENKQFLHELEAEGLITEKGENSYNLTRYGEMIKVMGIEVHEETARFEQQITGYTPDKRRMIGIALWVAFSMLVIFLVLMLLTDLDQWMMNLALKFI